jgi:hypothetical protein
MTARYNKRFDKIVRSGSLFKPEPVFMRQQLSGYFSVVCLILVFVAFMVQVVEVWPILATHVTSLMPAVLVHVGAALYVTGIGLKTYRKQAVLPADVMLLASFIFATWFTYLNLIGKFAVH